MPEIGYVGAVAVGGRRCVASDFSNSEHESPYPIETTAIRSSQRMSSPTGDARVVGPATFRDESQS